MQWLSATTLSDAHNDSTSLNDLDLIARSTSDEQVLYSPDSHIGAYSDKDVGPYGLRGLLAITSEDSPSDLLMMTIGDDPSNLGLDLDSSK